MKSKLALEHFLVGIVVLPALWLCTGCGGGGSGGTDMAGGGDQRSSSSQDLRGNPSPDLRSAPSPDLRIPAPDLLMSVDLRQPPQPDMSVCTGPANCGPATPYCCAHISLTGGSVPNCTVGTVDVACAATCDGDFALSCKAMDTARVCTAPADCANDPNGYTYCCEFSAGNLSANVCINSLIKTFTKPKCL